MSRHRKHWLVIASGITLTAAMSMVSPGLGQVKPPENVLTAKSDRTCRPLRPPAVDAGKWLEDTNYDLVESEVEGGKRIRIVGDILRISQKDFGSIIRDVDKAPSNIREIVLDAREVLIEAPLSFTSARVIILADSVVFGPRGSIYLTSNPGQPSDGLHIYARTIEFANAMPRPFQFTTSEATSRKVRIRANNLKIENKTIDPTNADITIWRMSAENFGASLSAIPAAWDVKTGPEATSDVLKAQNGVSVWPQFFAFKTQKFFARDPYNEAQNFELKSRIKNERPFIEQLENASSLVILDSTSALIDLGLDTLGHNESFVPRRDFVDASKDLKIRIDGAKEQLDRLKALILAAYSRKKLDESGISAVRERFRDVSKAAATHRGSMSHVFTALELNEREVEELQRGVDARRGVLNQRLEELKRRDADAANVKAVTTVVAVGAMLIPTPAAPVIATALSVSGDLIYGHNAGMPASVETLATIAQKNAKFYAAAKGAQAAWEAHRKDLDTAQQVYSGNPPKPEKPEDKPLTRVDASKKAAQSAGEFGGKIKEMFDTLQGLPKPNEVTMNALEAEDGDLRSLLAAIGDRRQKQGKLTESLVGLQKLVTAALGEQATAMAIEVDLLSVEATNDRDVQRWKLSAIALWRQYLEQLYRDAVLVRRSLHFETAKLPDLPPEVLQFPEEMTAYIRSGLYSPDQAGLAPAEVTAKHLEAEAQKHLAALRAIADATDRAFDAYRAERAGGAVPYIQTLTVTSKAAQGSVARLFLDQLNGQIQSQVVAAAAGRQFSTRPSALLFPISIPAPPQDIPERLIKVSVGEAKFSNPSALDGKTINVDISYELAGEMRWAGECNYVDMRTEGAASRAVERTQIDARQQSFDQVVVPLTFEEFKKYQTAPPARTPYFVSVQITGDPADKNWMNSPVLESLAISLRVVQ